MGVFGFFWPKFANLAEIVSGFGMNFVELSGQLYFEWANFYGVYRDSLD
jgi:hypothetical protein